MRWLSELLWICSCGLCGHHQSDYEDHGAQVKLRQPLLKHHVSANRSNLGGASAARPRSKQPLDVSNILGLGERDVTLDYDLGRLLGEGAFGVVRRCRNLATGQEFACKTIVKNQLRRHADVEDVRREVQILMMLSSHPNVAALVAIYEDKNAVHMILELCEGGQLFDEVCAQGRISERVAARYFRKMVEVVRHCHTLDIAHRDIKPENFLLSKPGPDGQIKAADFGLSQFYRGGRNFRSLVGSAYFVAPEVLQRNYGPQADVWSLGVCFYILLTGLPPFEGTTEEEIFDKILHADVDYSVAPWPLLSRSAKDIVQRMLTRDPFKRPTPAQLLQHTWLCMAGPDVSLGEEVIRRIRAFSGSTKVRRATMLMAEQHLQPGDTAAAPPIMAMLTELDAEDHMGGMTAEEVREGLGRAGIEVGSGEVRELMQAADAGGEGTTVTAPEFVAAALGQSTARRDDFIRGLFQYFEPDEMGRASLENVQTTLAKYGIGADDARVLDSDDDGVVTLQDFSDYLSRNTHSLQEAVRRRWHANHSPEKRGLETRREHNGEGGEDDDWIAD